MGTPAGGTNTIQKNGGGGNFAATLCTETTGVTCTEVITATGFTSSDTANSGTLILNGKTSGAASFVVADVAGTAIAYILPSDNSAGTGKFLQDTGSTTCPTLPAGAPATCHGTTWTAATVTGGTCTNQFVTIISTSGVPTCGTVTLASAQFANQGTTSTVLHGNAAGNPSFGQVAIGSDVSGLGTGVATALAANVSGSGAICLATASACAAGGGATGTSITNTTPVTVNANSTAEQFLMELAPAAGYFNSSGQPFQINGAFVYTTPAAQTPTITINVRLCTVSGCGSGTNRLLASIVTTATIASVTNNSVNVNLLAINHATGATGTLEVHGPLSVDLGALTTTAGSIFNDVNTAVSGTIDLTAALFLDFTVTFSTNAAGANSMTQRSGSVAPFAATAAPVTSIFSQTGAVGDLTGDVTTAGSTATTIAASAVTTGKINNAAVTAAKMVNAGVFTGDATTTFPAITIGNNAITAVKMVNAGVFTGDATSTFPAITIGAGAITNSKIANGTIDLTAKVTGALPAANIGVTANVFGSGTITIPSGNAILVGCTSTCSVPVPVPVAGYQICVKNNAGVSTVITLSALGSSALYPKADDSGYGTAGTGTMVSSAAAGNKVCLIGRDATHYELGAVNASANWTVN